MQGTRVLVADATSDAGRQHARLAHARLAHSHARAHRHRALGPAAPLAATTTAETPLQYRNFRYPQDRFKLPVTQYTQLNSLA